MYFKNKLPLGLLIFLLTQVSCNRDSLNKSQKNQFKQQLAALDSAYQDSLASQQGGLTESFLRGWGDRYWSLVQQDPNDSLSPKTANKALNIYRKLMNPNLIEQKLHQLSIDDRAMAGVLTYWNGALDNGNSHNPTHPYVQKLRAVARKSNSKEVKIAAHYYLAKWFTKFKYYKQVRHQLNILDLTYQVNMTDSQYRTGIKKIRASTGQLSAGKTMPAFNATMLDGSTLTQHDLQHKVTFLYFYGSTCGSCVHMYPVITKLYKKYRDEHFQVIGNCFDWQVSYGFNNRRQYNKFAQKFHIVWPQVITDDLWNKLHVNALSTGYLINQRGKIVRISRSDYVTDAAEGFEDTSLNEAVAKLL